jgi:mevalonate kinase
MKKNINLSANGKLLLTGEYLVLVGAEALAFPVRFGQTLFAEPDARKLIHWVSKENGVPWFTCCLDPLSLAIVSTSDRLIASRLADLLIAAKKINTEFLSENQGLNISVEANYPLNWGLGSSSTLIVLIAQWAEADPFLLFRSVSNGSGYDIACAVRNEMFLYRVRDEQPVIRKATPGKALIEYAYFAYLGSKQDTGKEVEMFLKRKNFSSGDIARISELSQLICQADAFEDLDCLVKEHEQILGRILNRNSIADQFPGFPGAVKSLGAWGGDFAMFVSNYDHQTVKSLLSGYGIRNVFTFPALRKNA